MATMSTLKEITAKDAKNRFGELLDAAQRSPVQITKNGRNVAVLVSREEYDRLKEFEDILLATRTKEVLRDAEFIGLKESEAFLAEILSRNNDDVYRRLRRLER